MPVPVAIAVTGLGVVSPLGTTVHDASARYAAGGSGITALEDAAYADLPVRIGAPCACPIERVLPAHRARRLDRCSQLGLIAADEAWSAAHRAHFSGDRIGVVFSSGIGGVSSLIEQLRVLDARGPGKVSPHTVALIMPNAPAAQISLACGASGWMEAPVSACSGGSEALARGVALLRAGVVDVVIAGGAEAILNRFGIAAFAAMQALSSANAAPGQASRPFDQARSGFVMGEGAGVLVLERLPEAQQRQASIHGLILGAGSSADAHDIVSPRPDGSQAVRAMALALAEANLQPSDLDLIKAHATGTIAGDQAEARALNRLFHGVAEADRPWVIAPKAVLGHLISASGPVETVLTLQALAAQQLPAQANCSQPDPQLQFRLPQQNEQLGAARGGGGHIALANSFGFGGRNISLVLQAAPLNGHQG